MLCSESDKVGGLLWCLDSASLLVWQMGTSLRLRLWMADGTVERSLTADDAAVGCVCLSDCGRVAAVLTADAKVGIWEQCFCWILIILHSYCSFQPGISNIYKRFHIKYMFIRKFWISSHTIMFHIKVVIPHPICFLIKLKII